MSDILSIPSYKASGGVVYYQVALKLPLRQSTVFKRYSDFVDLVEKLTGDLGINSSDFPYKLPPKSLGLFKFGNRQKEAFLEERQVSLARFLTQVIQDRDLQNSPIVHDFLQLPINFKFTSNLFRQQSPGNSRENDIIIGDHEMGNIDQFRWMELLRLIRSFVAELKTNYSRTVNHKIATRDKLNKLIRPNFDRLQTILQKHSDQHLIDEKEYLRRGLVAKEVEGEILELAAIIDGQSTAGSFPSDKEELFNTGKSSGKRVFGAPAQPRETKETLSLDNRALLQQQVQIHKSQDQEAEQLRKIIARQREIGMIINNEVEEQNELLDSFNQDVDTTTDKVKAARGRAKRIL